MNNLLFKKWNDFSGWIVFLIAAFVYGMTIEPTASFWDCPEFISCAEKLQVGHPPGAPFYMLVGNLFTQFASEASQVSWLVNFLNALLSAGCILFLFWSITRLVRSLIVNEEQNLSTIDVIVILGSGFVGALAYTFSDTFWFSAVEGEVYAFSSFLTALVFWMILRWQDESDSVYGDRWIILIAYIIGLSIGVHLLNLLCIPAIVLVFYYQKYHAISFKGVAAAIVISGLLIVFILFQPVQVYPYRNLLHLLEVYHLYDGDGVVIGGGSVTARVRDIHVVVDNFHLFGLISHRDLACHGERCGVDFVDRAFRRVGVDEHGTYI